MRVRTEDGGLRRSRAPYKLAIPPLPSPPSLPFPPPPPRVVAGAAPGRLPQAHRREHDDGHLRRLLTACALHTPCTRVWLNPCLARASDMVDGVRLSTGHPSETQCSRSAYLCVGTPFAACWATRPFLGAKKIKLINTTTPDGLSIERIQSD